MLYSASVPQIGNVTLLEENCKHRMQILVLCWLSGVSLEPFQL